MIVFDLKCPDNHRFEAWFRSSSAFEEQCAAGVVECPYCGSAEIVKAPMAPNVAAKGNTQPEARPAQMQNMVHAEGDGRLAELAAQAREIVNQMREHVEKNCDYVGANFAEEARKIHYGEADERGIYGESTTEETQALIEEGIDILPLPGNRSTDA
ncbi:DUF1178 family protein [Kordiimonas marina]|uniref:DUF1178 family protein n=1 Tax=Kordiimonas marina TaxID=2872312 RepID=UPI001FF1916F|nr:DUF1178 family protein [Kordiimonas marina]MCJ9430455.1 DUF1178 family protein [Kordiimonas marina]